MVGNCNNYEDSRVGMVGGRSDAYTYTMPREFSTGRTIPSQHRSKVSRNDAGNHNYDNSSVSSVAAVAGDQRQRAQGHRERMFAVDNDDTDDDDERAAAAAHPPASRAPHATHRLYPNAKENTRYVQNAKTKNSSVGAKFTKATLNLVKGAECEKKWTAKAGKAEAASKAKKRAPLRSVLLDGGRNRKIVSLPDIC